MSNDIDEHPEELLPWLVNDTLKGEERAMVERHVARCAFCQAEVELLRSMRAAVKVEPVQDPGEIGLARLMRDVRTGSRESKMRWLLPAAIAASVAITVPAVLLLQPRPPVYGPLSAPAADTPLIQIRFKPQAEIREVQALLRNHGASIVDGPSATGLYRVMVEPAGRTKEVLKELRSRTDLVGDAALEP